jgi:hypothetical protein
MDIYFNSGDNMFRPLFFYVFQVFMFQQLCIAYMLLYTHQQRYINENKIFPKTDKFIIFAILYFYNFMLV